VRAEVGSVGSSPRFDLQEKGRETYEEPGVRGGVGSGEGGGRHWTDSTVFCVMYAVAPSSYRQLHCSAGKRTRKGGRTDHRVGQWRTHELDKRRVVPVGRDERARVPSRCLRRHNCSAASLAKEVRRGRSVMSDGSEGRVRGSAQQQELARSSGAHRVLEESLKQRTASKRAAEGREAGRTESTEGLLAGSPGGAGIKLRAFGAGAGPS
jgi:hypothetical protein